MGLVEVPQAVDHGFLDANSLPEAYRFSRWLRILMLFALVVIKCKQKVKSLRKRIHFHEWMIDVHSRLHQKQKGHSFASKYTCRDLTVAVLAGSSGNTDSTADDLVEQAALCSLKTASCGMIPTLLGPRQVAADMMKEAWLLCFDEFQVTHISHLAMRPLSLS